MIRVLGLWFRGWGLGFGVEGLGSRLKARIGFQLQSSDRHKAHAWQKRYLPEGSRVCRSHKPPKPARLTATVNYKDPRDI